MAENWTPDYDDPREVYAVFGLTFFNACVLEQGLVNCTIALRATGNLNITTREIGELFDSLDKQRATFGTILREIRKHSQLDPSLDDDLTKALGHRNHLAHKFFVDHDLAIRTTSGRKAMIDELIEIRRFLKDVDTRFDVVWKNAWSAWGLTQEWIDKQLDRMMADYKAANP